MIMPKTFSKLFFTARVIADALRVSQKTVHRRARRENWPARSNGYRIEYRVPRSVLRLCQASASSPIPSILYQPARIRELKRAAAVLGFVLEMQRDPQRGIEWTLQATVKRFKHLMRFSVGILRRWVSGVEGGGVAALAEHKAGRVGRKAARLDKILR
ncbi:MAG TPA: hypothetical protein VN784_09180 [Candidatus Limnocylindrales bacterium]|nr:hypothetical protein [Candidatus Limnocylindrales bacterium]